MIELPSKPKLQEQIPALLPRGDGHQFVFYGDACSGVPGALHEQTFAATPTAVLPIARSKEPDSPPAWPVRRRCLWPQRRGLQGWQGVAARRNHEKP